MAATFSGSSISSPREWVDERPSTATHAADRFVTCRLGRRRRQGREGRRPSRPVATLIRHAQQNQAPPVLPLAVAVIQPPFLAALMSSIGCAALLSPRLVPTPL
jgi:hypothetical protein